MVLSLLLLPGLRGILKAIHLVAPEAARVKPSRLLPLVIGRPNGSWRFRTQIVQDHMQPHGHDRQTVLQKMRARSDLGFEGLRAEGGKQMTEPDRLATRPWTAADDELLQSLALKRMDAKVIGMQMSRTPASVRRRASRLNIILRKSRPQKQMS